jgi:hypothetical protein
MCEMREIECASGECVCVVGSGVVDVVLLQDRIFFLYAPDEGSERTSVLFRSLSGSGSLFSVSLLSHHARILGTFNKIPLTILGVLLFNVTLSNTEVMAVLIGMCA